MYRKFEKIFLVAQVILAVSVVLFGAAYGLHCLFAGNIFCAVCFTLIGYVSGYRLLFLASIKELREYNSKQIQTK